MELILVRHGQTAWNVEEIFRGRADVELNEAGRRQAVLLGEFLSDRRIEVVYSSPLKRARDTALAIARHHDLDVRISEGLNDMDFGEWEGMPVDAVKARYPEAYAEWYNHPELARVSGGEMLGRVRERATAVVKDVVAAHQGRVVLVTHRVIVKILTLAMLGLDESRFWNVVVDTCGATTFRVSDGRNVLVRHNDTSFLKSSGASLADF